MPELARQLGVGTTSVYWYFRNKDELLRAIGDRATEEFYAGLDDDTGLRGDDRILQHFRVFWSRLRENPLWREVFISGFWRTVSTSEKGAARAANVHHRQVTRMMAAGLSVADATNAYTILSAYTRGYVMVEHLRSADALPTTRAEMTAEVHGLAGYGEIERAAASANPNETFELGLRALWSGLLRKAEVTAAVC